MQNIKQILDNSKNGSTFDKMQAMHQIRKQLSDNPVIAQYRGADWQRYLRNVGTILACTVAFPIGGVAALVSYMRYNTFQFWQTTGYKEKELLLSNIESVEKKLKV